MQNDIYAVDTVYIKSSRTIETILILQIINYQCFIFYSFLYFKKKLTNTK